MKQRGMVLLGVLVLLAVLAALGAQIGMRWADERARDDEEELLFVGEQYRAAIESYWRSSPGGVRQFPAQLDDLLADKRFPTPRRHLRKLYRDPVAPERPWAEIRLGNGIVGVHSQSEAEPFRRSGFTLRQARFAEAQRHADWAFSAVTGPASAASAPAFVPPPARSASNPFLPPRSPRRHLP
ncbi:MAG: type II secretion system protein [Proteobacteria bacterium]|nr:type II secretion system protein [Pseudomonadota bacterium]